MVNSNALFVTTQCQILKNMYRREFIKNNTKLNKKQSPQTIFFSFYLPILSKTLPSTEQIQHQPLKKLSNIFLFLFFNIFYRCKAFSPPILKTYKAANVFIVPYWFFLENHSLSIMPKRWLSQFLFFVLLGRGKICIFFLFIPNKF